MHVILLSALLPCPCEAYPEAACFWNTLKSPKTWCIRYSLRLRPVLLHRSRTVHRIDPDAVHYNGSYNGTAFPSPWSHQHQPGSQNHKQEKRSRPYFFHCRVSYSLSSKIKNAAHPNSMGCTASERLAFCLMELFCRQFQKFLVRLDALGHKLPIPEQRVCCDGCGTFCAVSFSVMWMALNGIPCSLATSCTFGTQ